MPAILAAQVGYIYLCITYIGYIYVCITYIGYIYVCITYIGYIYVCVLHIYKESTSGCGGALQIELE
jgi:hypothetical protein